MRSLSFLLTLSIFLVSFQASSASKLIIENATLIDAATLVRENMTVVVQGDEIRSIEKSSSKNITIERDPHKPPLEHQTFPLKCKRFEHIL